MATSHSTSDLRDALATTITQCRHRLDDFTHDQSNILADAILAEFIVVPIGDSKPSIQPWLDAERLTYEAVSDAERSDRNLHDVLAGPPALTPAQQKVAQHLGERVLDLPPEQRPDIEGLRCYSCGHEFSGRRWSIDTTCPECGSNSFSRRQDATEPADDLDVGDDAPTPTRCDKPVGSRPSWMGVDQYDPCRCMLARGHLGGCVCEHGTDV